MALKPYFSRLLARRSQQSYHRSTFTLPSTSALPRFSSSSLLRPNPRPRHLSLPSFLSRRSYVKPAWTPSEKDEIVFLTQSLIKRKMLAIESASTASSEVREADVENLRSEIGALSKALEEVLQAEKSHQETEEMSQTDPDPELRSLASSDLPSLLTSLEKAQAVLRDLVLSQHPSPTAHLNLAPIIIDFTPGEGGPDSCLWIANLLKIYEKEFVKEGWKWKVVNERWTTITGSAAGTFGLKECSVEVFDPKAGRRGDGEVGVYGRFKWETGVHRLQMISEADKAGRIMTSAAVVYVLPTGPLVSDDVEEDVLDMKDVRIDLLKASGPGGQHVNKTESAVRLVHLPTNITVNMQDSRSQPENKSAAIVILRSRLMDLRRQARNDAIQAQRKSSIRGTSKSDRIRTYNHQQGRVTDHRINLSVGLPSVEQGGIGLETIHMGLEERDEDDRLKDLREELEAEVD
ncbi:hypothetical protein BDY24DRAFT_375024 [Mrakia frigida]|uniref:uncharacterized protein n=1 Tax=Mrakia frigida TaxID=29902 RepID=UPI003FCBFFBB